MVGTLHLLSDQSREWLENRVHALLLTKRGEPHEALITKARY